MSAAEDLLQFHLKAAKLPEPVRELKFHHTRKWRFDFAYPAQMIGIEVEGGVWSGGRHTRGNGYSADCEKYNHAELLGWKVYRFTPAIIKSGEAVAMIALALEASINT